MKSAQLRGAGSAAAFLMLLASARADTVKLTYISEGAMSKLGYNYSSLLLTLSAQKPKSLKKAPKDLTSPLYGVLTLGPRENPTSYMVILDEPNGKEAHLYVDANGNGDLTDDPVPNWTRRSYQGTNGKQYTEYNGGATLQFKYGKEKMLLHLGMYRFDTRDTARAGLKDKLLYYRDYAWVGEMKLLDKTYKVVLSDDGVVGDFRGKAGSPGGSGVNLLIDLDGDGKFKGPRETYDVTRPFNIDGITYELSDISPSGNSFEVSVASRSVAEVPDLRLGKQAVSFEGKAIGGQDIHFPTAYKGKIVLLDFWAMWSGPNVAELPNLARVYAKYHARGLEILGVSLDLPNAADKLAAFTRARNMPWPQLYDGKYKEAEIAKLYLVEKLPQAYLVDGDTGEILADNATLRGPSLDETIAAALKKKSL